MTNRFVGSMTNDKRIKGMQTREAYLMGEIGKGGKGDTPVPKPSVQDAGKVIKVSNSGVYILDNESGGSYTPGDGISIENNVISNTKPNYQPDWNQDNPNEPDFIKNKPENVPTPSVQDAGKVIKVSNSGVYILDNESGGSYIPGDGISIENNVISNTKPNYQPDWSQNDPNAPDYIKNKPENEGYTYVEERTILCPNNLQPGAVVYQRINELENNKDYLIYYVMTNTSVVTYTSVVVSSSATIKIYNNGNEVVAEDSVIGKIFIWSKPTIYVSGTAIFNGSYSGKKELPTPFVEGYSLTIRNNVPVWADIGSITKTVYDYNNIISYSDFVTAMNNLVIGDEIIFSKTKIANSNDSYVLFGKFTKVYSNLMTGSAFFRNSSGQSNKKTIVELTTSNFTLYTESESENVPITELPLFDTDNSGSIIIIKH